jgi:hypothetical protein
VTYRVPVADRGSKHITKPDSQVELIKDIQFVVRRSQGLYAKLKPLGGKHSRPWTVNRINKQRQLNAESWCFACSGRTEDRFAKDSEDMLVNGQRVPRCRNFSNEVTFTAGTK